MNILNYFFWKHIILHKFDIICLSETYLDSTIPNDDDKFQIPGYTLILTIHLLQNVMESVYIIKVLYR